MSLKKLAISGLKWNFLNTFFVSILTFIRLWVLAFLLSPEDFGLMAMVLTVTELANAYSDTGISAAIIHRQEATDRELSSLYWLNIATGTIIFLIILLATPIIVIFYKEPRLSLLLPVASLSLIITSFGNQYAALLQRDTQFSTLAKQDLISVVFGTAVMIIAALAGLKVWSLVLGQIATSISKTVSLIVVGLKRHRPHMHFCRADLKGYLGFGFYQMADRTINYMSGRMDQLLIGYLMGAQTLGYYNFAFNLVMQPLYKINSVITVVSFPIFARIQNDLNMLRRGFLDLINFIFYINAPLLVWLACVAPILITTVFGEKWAGSVIFIQVLAFVALLRSTNDPVASIGLAKGRADLLFYWNLYLVLANIIFMYVGFKFMDTVGIAAGLLFVRVISIAPNYFFVISPTIGKCGTLFFKNMFKPITFALAMGVGIVVLSDLVEGTPIFYLIKITLFGISIFLALLFLLDRKIITTMENLIRQ